MRGKRVSGKSFENQSEKSMDSIAGKRGVCSVGFASTCEMNQMRRLNIYFNNVFTRMFAATYVQYGKGTTPSRKIALKIRQRISASETELY